MYKYILEKKISYSKKIIFFGMSFGTTQLFAALSDEKTKKYISKNTKKFIAMAPVTSMTNFALNDSPFKMKLYNNLNKLLQNIGIYELNFSSGNTTFDTNLRLLIYKLYTLVHGTFSIIQDYLYIK